MITDAWLNDPTGLYPCPDVDIDNDVDLVDFGIVADYWKVLGDAAFKGRQSGINYDPGLLDPATNYYWRIDEVNGPTTWKGDLWSFSTPIPAFPGAEGFGAYSVGGRGGTVCEVTNLNNSGPGSLREAIDASGPRTVVFCVSGTINLTSTLSINDPYITIAGQSAPGNGITMKMLSTNAIMEIETHHVIIRNMRLRAGPGDAPSTSLRNLHIGNRGNNIIIDHCSFSWGVDENADTWNEAHDITYQWCIISEGLHCSNHAERCHSSGLLLGSEGSENISVHHNLFAHNVTRNPRIKTSGLVDVVNNVIYNGSNSASTDDYAIVPVNYIGNYVKRYGSWYVATVDVGGYGFEIYVEGNISSTRPTDDLEQYLIVNPDDRGYIVPDPHDSPAITTTSAFDAYDQVSALDGSGMILPGRDTVDVRIINEVINGTGGFIDDPAEVGGWPTLYSLTAPVDSDHDGMPDFWESQYGLNPGDAADRNGNIDGDVYTNLEEYLNNTNPTSGIEPIVYVATTLPIAYEETGGDGQFMVYRNGATDSALTVNYTASGSATAGSDYTTLSGSVTIPTGASSATIDVTPINDPDADDNEQVIVSIDADSNYKIGLPRKNLIVIEDED